MINDILEGGLYGEIILGFILIAYIFMRYIQRKLQKQHNWTNFEFWVYYNLVDYYKDNGYPYPENRATEEINRIIKLKNQECKI